MMALDKEQEIIMNIADMILETFICESLLLRVQKLSQLKSEAEVSLQVDMMQTFINDALDRINFSGKNAINSFAEGDELRMMLLGLKRFTKADPFNSKDARRRIAAKLIEENKYCF